MPKRHTYRVPLPCGGEATRTTHRTYTHIVVAKPSEADAREWAAATAKRDAKSDYSWYSQIIRAGIGGRTEGGQAVNEHLFSRALSQLEGVASLAGYEQKLKAERLAHVDQLVSEGYYQRFHVVGWAGRPDLADKLLASKEHPELRIERHIIAIPPTAALV